VEEPSIMQLRRSCCVGLGRWGSIAGIVLAAFVANRQADGAPPAAAQSAANAPLAAPEALRRITVPEGFAVSLFAAEPDVVQPIAMTLDHKGRLWVVENYSYPIWLGGPRGKDRILIFEDDDNDGRFDRRTVFFDKGTNFTGIELGFGGVWVCATPNLLFIPDSDGDLRPDGEPVAKLDGWDTKAQHNMFNGLKWGPDGWLWGCNGILSNSRVGKPGTPDPKRVAINCGVWRYHPTRAIFEAVAHGTTNPWGLDFDDLGEAFITNCVIPHLFHVVPGAHFTRMYGEDIAPHSYALLETCADHIHWAGGKWTDSREGKGKHGEAGGGHAHVGAMIYLGDNWPDRYRNDVFTCNIHGKRLNRDRLESKGSTYVARHEPDFLMANDPWFRGLELKYGPDGAVYMTDWYDTGECHENDADNAHRENGRIYKIAYGKSKPVKVDLAALDEKALAELQLHHNDWYVRTARRLLQERAAAGRELGQAHRVLREILATNPDATRQLRAVWALHATGGLDETAALALLDHASEHVRAWGVRLLCDRGPPPASAVARLALLAKNDPSQKVRLSLASALQRLPLNERWAFAEPLTKHKEDAPDAMLPLMVWYGVEPLVANDLKRAVALAVGSEIPIVRRFVARRTVEADPGAGLAAVISLLKGASDRAAVDLVIGSHDALRGRKHVARPDNWSEALAGLLARPDLNLVEQALLLALDVDDPRAGSVLRGLVRDRETPLDMRQRALSALADRRVPGVLADLRGLVDDPTIRGPALRAMAAYDDPTTPEIVLSHYARFTEPERGDAIATLSARPAWALALLDAVERGLIPRAHINVTVARQLLALADPRVRPRLETVWGKVQPTSKIKTGLISKFKSVLASTQDPPPDAARGRAVFNRTCLSCHKLFDAGGDVGPELTGSDRANPDYILENVLDPSAAVSRDYTVTNVATNYGRLVSGIIRQETPTSLVIQTANERVVVPREDVEAIKLSTNSMMPEGLLEPLTTREIRDLFAYLAATKQLPPPDGK
jgi:putative membrane-bound dehydrogenase-like protein